ncbi:MAG: sulfotransferase [Planctomycetes bacterium]|nr:sulfotransferase [Planctomycetota bacterium]MCB9903604.1 sulfotransferase [Planctomycetota bacterium]
MTTTETITVDVQRPVVVCGVGRSGTSLLQSMLNAHPELCFPPETHFFRRYVADAGVRRRYQRLGTNALQAALFSDADFARAGLDAAVLLQPESGRGLDTARVFRRLLQRVAARSGKTRIGDKDPRSLDHLAAWKREFPAARVVHVIRDPRDVLLSRTKAAWSAGRPWWAHVMICKEQLRRGRKLGRRLFGEAYLEVRYEQLIADPDAVLRRICEHVDLEFDARMLEFGESAKQLVDQRELAWKKETLGPLLTNNMEKWRTGLSAFQVRMTERVARECFRELGYVEDQGRAALRFPEQVALHCAPLLRLFAAAAFDLRRALGRA